ncbi:Nif3-like dinuclear metal center hexameric protein [Proteinivorax hydrogeniformans]|uniref:GTP cyclohydrolase 1 type 2 homolog n=1 Tax=Proteinivorax hydrogeniformans TaxID=1826727 RepID=A0AAU8HQ21_9FIRM
MALAIAEITKELESIAPKSLAYFSKDNNGLLVGDSSQKVNKVMVTLDITEDIMEYAIKSKCDLIISHHPIIFGGIDKIDTKSKTGRIIIKAIQNNISIYAAHTNLDVAWGGVNDSLAKKLGLKVTGVLDKIEASKYYKVVVFVPLDYKEKVLDAMAQQGAGNIGDYSHCTFTTLGEGTFKPLEGSNPFLGETGNLETVKEVKIESIVSSDRLGGVLSGMKNAHPYEEVAYDVLPLQNNPDVYGLGRTTVLEAPITSIELANHVKKELNCTAVKFFGDKGKKVSKVAVLGGSGGSLIKKAKKLNCHAIITSDVDYHQGQLADELDICIIDPGHYHTEVVIVEDIAQKLNKVFSGKVDFQTALNNCPYSYI